MLNFNELKIKIKKLIDSHREGAYWDFKQQWYQKNSDMLHDIICMANNLENRDAYIIIGVTDDFQICGVDNDDNRKCTHELTDFLRGKKFAGDFRPMVEVQTISLDGHVLDIIIIKNSDKVPYYLTENNKTKLRPYHIYTRVQDSNTPKDKSADLIHVEMLWKKRFHLLDQPIKKFEYLLSEKKNWIEYVSEEGITFRYHKNFPEYTIKFYRSEDSEDSSEDIFQETFMLTQLDPHGFWCSINLFYHQTLLLTLQGVRLDGGRFLTVVPTLETLSIKSKTIDYYYFFKNSLPFKLYEFFIHNEDPRDYLANQRLCEETLFFEDEEEMEAFKHYFHQYLQKYDECLKKIQCNDKRKRISQNQEEYYKRLALKSIYLDFKNGNGEKFFKRG